MPIKATVRKLDRKQPKIIMSEHKKKKNKGGKSKEDGDIKEPKEAKKAKPTKNPAGPKAAKLAVAKPRGKKAPGTPGRKKASKPEPIIHIELISMRAYFISEKRRSRGEHGDEHGDWIEAEHQLKAEAKPAEAASSLSLLAIPEEK